MEKIQTLDLSQGFKDSRNEIDKRLKLSFGFHILCPSGVDYFKRANFPLTHSPIHSKIDGKDQESIQSSITPDRGYQWESNKLTIRHHKREPRGQSFPSR